MALIADDTETAVANAALAHIKITATLSIDADDGFKARTCRLLFPRVRDDLLRRYPWNFAECRDSVAASATKPEFGFCRSFPLPNDPYCLAVRELPQTRRHDRWRVKGRAVYCDLSAPLQIIYTGRITDVSLWDAQFRTAVEYSLASALAWPLAHDRDLGKEMAQLAADSAADAFPADAAEGEDDNTAPEQDIIAERY